MTEVAAKMDSSEAQPASLMVSITPEFLDAIGVRVQPLASANEILDRSPWLTVAEAAQRVGYNNESGRAPETIYKLARQIGHKVGARWLIHVDDLDRAIRDGLLA